MLILYCVSVYVVFTLFFFSFLVVNVIKNIIQLYDFLNLVKCCYFLNLFIQ